MRENPSQIEEPNNILLFYMPAVIILGALVFAQSILHLPIEKFDGRFLIVVVLTLACAGTTIQFPLVKSRFSFSDPFIYLTLLLYGAEAGVLLASLDALVSSFYFSKKKMTIFFNAAMMGLSTFLTAAVLNLCFGSIETIALHNFTGEFILALCLMGLSQYLINTVLSAIYGAAKKNQPLWEIWTTAYLWNSVSYFAGAAGAGIIFQLIQIIGFYALAAVAPIAVILYLSHRMYLKNIEISRLQAEQAQLHADRIRESEERFRGAFDYASTGMALVSPTGEWLKVNASLCRIFGYTEEELLKMNVQSLTHQCDLAQLQKKLIEISSGETDSYQLESRFIRREGGDVWVQCSASTAVDAKGNLMYLIVQIQDVSARKNAEKKLIYEASHDALTGLMNRAAFKRRLESCFDQSKQHADYHFAVLFLDLDRFKIINDSLGHDAGDQLLISVARRLETCIRNGDLLARLGGDEFTILLDNIQSNSEAVRIAERINEIIAQPFTLNSGEVFTSTSVGVAFNRATYLQPDEILRDADAAMYQAKKRGKACYEIFDPTLRAQTDTILQTETDLRRALERNELSIYFQPIVELANSNPVAFEALLRWNHPLHGLIAPDKFIPVAEETGMIIPIGLWTLREACRQMRVWQQRFPHFAPLTLNVNLSVKQLLQSTLPGQVRDILRETNFEPGLLNLEITESVLMEDDSRVRENINSLRELGINISLDDFGTGYSSLSYLNRFPIDVLKIDRSFVRDLDVNQQSSKIVKTIISLAQTLGIKAVAEGIETPRQMTELKKSNCQYGQGFLFSKPLPADSVDGYLSQIFAPQLDFRLSSEKNEEHFAGYVN